MSQETDALLRSLLFQALLAQRRGLEPDYMLHVIKVMCSKDMIAAAVQEVDEMIGNAEENG